MLLCYIDSTNTYVYSNAHNFSTVISVSTSSRYRSTRIEESIAIAMPLKILSMSSLEPHLSLQSQLPKNTATFHYFLQGVSPQSHLARSDETVHHDDAVVKCRSEYFLHNVSYHPGV